jgi:hypothetical protein
VAQAPIGAHARPPRRLGCVGVGLSVGAGAVLGFIAAAVVDAATTVQWRGAWTLIAVAGGAAVGLVGVMAWPMIAGTVRILFGRPPLRPPWWAGLWVLLGAAPTAAILQLRADHRPTRFGAIVLLLPVAIGRFVRTRRRLRST